MTCRSVRQMASNGSSVALGSVPAAVPARPPTRGDMYRRERYDARSWLSWHSLQNPLWELSRRATFRNGDLGKGDRHLLPERPFGCFAQKVPVPFSRRLVEPVLSLYLEAASRSCYLPGERNRHHTIRHITHALLRQEIMVSQRGSFFPRKQSQHQFAEGFSPDELLKI